MTTHSSALLMVDFQNSFFRANGVIGRLHGTVHGADKLIAEARDLVASARHAGVPIIYTRHGFQPDYSDVDRVFRDLLPAAMSMGGLRLDRWDSAVVDELTPLPGDTVVLKNRFDSFFRTDLEQILDAAGVDTIAVAGALTNVCVETTVRSAFQHDLYVHVLRDCCGARTAEDHERALTAIERARFATVTRWRTWLEATGSQPRARGRAGG